MDSVREHKRESKMADVTDSGLLTTDIDLLFAAAAMAISSR
jgi:hypothetical protein